MSEEKLDSNEIIIENLINFLNSINYITTINNFISLNCLEFQNYYINSKNGIGNKLEWIEIYHKYIELIEEQLELFSLQYNLTNDRIINEIENYILKYNDNEFLPLYLKIIDENYFFEQMYSYSIEKLLINNVNEISENEEKGEETMTGKIIYIYIFIILILFFFLLGLWYIDPERTNEEELSNWLTVLGIPWVFRKLFIRSQRSSSKVIVSHESNQLFNIVTHVPVFGTWNVNVNLTDTWANHSSRLGDPVRIRGVESEPNIVNIQLKNTKTGVLQVFTISYENEYLKLYREMYLSGIQEGHPNATLSTYLLRR